jgi:hypothetical protein
MGDLSYAGDDKRDLCVLYVIRYWQGQLYQVDCNFGKWDSWALAQELFGMIAKHRPTIVWLERFQGWEAYNTVFEIFARDHNIQKFPVEWYKINNQENAKTIRIGAVKGVLAQRRLWLYGHSPGYKELCEQLEKFPKSGKHDDFADCIGLACEVPTGYQLEVPKDTYSVKSFIRKLHEVADDTYYDTRIPGSY